MKKFLLPILIIGLGVFSFYKYQQTKNSNHIPVNISEKYKTEDSTETPNPFKSLSKVVEKVPVISTTAVYSLPEDAMYKESAEWKPYQVENTELALKDSWGIVPLKDAPRMLTNHNSGDSYFSLQIDTMPDKKSSAMRLLEVKEATEKAKDIAKNYGSTAASIDNTQLIDINGRPSAIIWTSIERASQKILGIHVFIEGNTKDYHLLISIADAFYLKNKSDIYKLITSFKPLE